MNRKPFILLVLLTIAPFASILAADYIILQDTFSEGGGEASSNSFLLCDLTGQSVTGMSESENYIESAGLLFFDMGTFVGTEEPKVSQSLPKIYNLLQNYPNPTRGATTIRYTLPKETYVSLRIYDITGRMVRKLIDESQNPGFYTLNWDGKDDGGKLLPSGVYFYCIEAESYRATKGLILLR